MSKKKKPIKVVHRKLGREKADGLAWKDYRIIEIDERLNGHAYLETTVHEVIHIQNPKWGEAMVTGRAKELADILWGLGFRWVDIK